MSNVSTRSDFNVEVVRITAVTAHPNADRLDILATTAGYPVLDTRGKYAVGDLAVYVPVDAIVPLSNPAFAFLGTKPGQTEARISARRLRGVYSEGLLVSIWTLDTMGRLIKDYPHFKEGDNVQEKLGIRKHQSAADIRESAAPTAKRATSRAPKGMPIYGLDSLSRFPDAIPLGTPVVITEKIHGCNARYRYENGRLYVGSHKVMRGDSGSPFMNRVRALWRKARGLFRRTRKDGGNNPDVTHGDIWWRIAEEYNLKDALSHYPGLTFYGEIYGKSLQVRGGVDFVYDSPDGLAFRVFDIWDESKRAFLSFEDMKMLAFKCDLKISPVPYRGPWLDLQQTVECVNKAAMLPFGLHLREGWVVRTDVTESDPNRKTFKYVSPEYKLLGAKEAA